MPKKMESHDKVDYFINHDLDSIVTPIKVQVLESLLKETNYNEDKTNYLIEGFKNGFNIGYRGPLNGADVSDNITLKAGVGSKTEVWNKVMKEVGLKRYAGPYENIPFQNYMQSPIRLVLKDGGKQTRLIFHLSYNFW